MGTTENVMNYGITGTELDRAIANKLMRQQIKFPRMEN